MKKDRNSFFGSSNFNMSAMGDGMGNMNMQNMMPNMNMGMPSVNAASSQFYAAQNMPTQLPILYNNDGNGAIASNSTFSELESRMAKLERSINRLDARLSKLEGSTFYTKDEYDADGNMYMV